MIFYHATLKQNVFSIMKNGLKPGADGLIYLCKSPEDCLKFFSIKPLYKGKEIAVIPVDIDPERVKISNDHNKKYINCDAFIYEGEIPADKTPKDLGKISLYYFE